MSRASTAGGGWDMNEIPYAGQPRPLSPPLELQMCTEMCGIAPEQMGTKAHDTSPLVSHSR